MWQEQSSLIHTHRYAFALDIDGTLTAGAKALPRAGDAIRMLQSNKIPFVLLTSNISRSPQEKAYQVSQMLRLDPPLGPEHIILNYTPILSMESWQGKRVLFVGRQQVLDRVLPLPHVPNYITVEEYAIVFPHSVPLSERGFDGESERLKAELCDRLDVAFKDISVEWVNAAIDAVVVLCAPRRWEETYQILIDVLGPRKERNVLPVSQENILIKKSKMVIEGAINIFKSFTTIDPIPSSLITKQGSLEVIQQSSMPSEYSLKSTMNMKSQQSLKMFTTQRISMQMRDNQSFKLLPGTFSKIRRDSAYFQQGGDLQMKVSVVEEPIAQIPVIVALNDMFYLHEGHPLPRILIKPFNDGLKCLYREIYKQDLQVLHYGKPESNTFHYARLHLEKIHGPIDKIVMVGDNEESDIVGASNVGWESILVLTGVTKRISTLATVNSTGIYEGIISYFIKEGVLNSEEALDSEEESVANHPNAKISTVMDRFQKI